jgi:nicotinamide-nucleotide adenylyltransferase
MQNLKRVLFIGRFQPFHLGHLSVIEEIDNRADVKEIVIGVGSSQYDNTEENPYSYDIREEMIIRNLYRKIKKPYKIIAIPDIHNNNLWVDHVTDIVCETNEVYTGNKWVANLFKEKEYIVKPVKIKIKITGTQLRKMIKDKDDSWKNFVSSKIYNLISHE